MLRPTTQRSLPSADKRSSQPVCIVTGANAGIGLEVVAGLREEGHNVIMACRSLSRCANAKASLDQRGLPGSCECRQVDVADLGSVRAFASDLADSGSRVAILVNNAGVMGVPPTDQGANGHMAPNHYGPFLLTRLLLPLMAAQGRIVNVGSEAHRRAPRWSGRPAATAGELSEFDCSHNNWYADYAASKLANLQFTAELSRRLLERRSSVTAYCVSPGRVATNIFRNVPGLLQRPLELLAGLLFQTPKQGARTVLAAALSPELQGKHVLYMHNQKAAEPAAAGRDAVSAAALWQHSVRSVGLSDAEDAGLWVRL